MIKKIDFPMFFVILLLIAVGLITLSSASSYLALQSTDNSNYFLFRQLGFALVGIIAMIFISNINYGKYKKIAYLGFLITALLMIAVLIPRIWC
ncbi:MAG: FtsW/RodA/SpoVE family cell cycle protein [Clostridia bacterium]